MSQAIIITAYKNFEQLDFLADFFSPCFDVFIHVDKKSEEISKDKIVLLNSKKNVYAIQKYNIKWGGKDHLNAILFLMDKALKKGDSFLHVISGEDSFPSSRFRRLPSVYRNVSITKPGRNFLIIIPAALGHSAWSDMQKNLREHH